MADRGKRRSSSPPKKARAGGGRGAAAGSAGGAAGAKKKPGGAAGRTRTKKGAGAAAAAAAGVKTKVVAGIETIDQDPTDIFEFLAQLGEGSYGSVYKARDKRDGTVVAIKVLEIENEDTASLKREINILSQCHSRHIVAYKGSFSKLGHLWIVMELCALGSISDILAICDMTLSEQQIRIICKKALLGLVYLHEQNMIHRDIKAGNILITEAGEAKLADFGVSAELTNSMPKRTTTIGTPYWMSPEVLKGDEYNGRADIWSLGITAIEMATGEPPLSNVHPMRALFIIPNSAPPALPESEQYSDEFRDFVRVCLIKDPAKRPDAFTLLKTHPFITKAGSSAIITRLVEECLPLIEEYRDLEALEAEAQSQTQSHSHSAGTGFSDMSTLSYGRRPGSSGVKTTLPRHSGGITPSPLPSESDDRSGSASVADGDDGGDSEHGGPVAMVGASGLRPEHLVRPGARAGMSPFSLAETKLDDEQLRELAEIDYTPYFKTIRLKKIALRNKFRQHHASTWDAAKPGGGKGGDKDKGKGKGKAKGKGGRKADGGDA